MAKQREPRKSTLSDNLGHMDDIISTAILYGEYDQYIAGEH
jgi:hypothetical protein